MHMPPNSYWPMFTAFGVNMTFVLFLTNRSGGMPLIGVAWTAIGVHQLGIRTDTLRRSGSGRERVYTRPGPGPRT
jgi:hypothetical protein